MARAFLIIALGLAGAADVDMTPIAKVLEMIHELETKIIQEGGMEQNVYTKFAEWCETRSRELHFDIKTGNDEIASLKAAIEDEKALAGKLNAKIEELAAQIAQDESDLNDATLVRNKDHADFISEENELTQAISMIKRANGILEREMARTDSSTGTYLLQSKHVSDMAQVFKTLVDASMFSSADAAKLTALVQSSQESDDDGLGVNAPASKTYAGQSGTVIDVLQSLLEKADAQLAEARKEESNESQNFKMLRQSLEDAIKFANREMAEAKRDLQASNERRATAEADLRETTRVRDEDQATLDETHNNCLNRANEFQAATNSRAEELHACAQAKDVIKATTEGANQITYGLVQDPSFFQIARSEISTKADLSSFEAIRYVRDLAEKEKSPALAQLASRMAATMRLGGRNGDDVFSKVKGLISDMIGRLTAEGDADQLHEEWCRREEAENNQKVENKNGEIAKLTAAIDKMSSRNAMLRSEVVALQKQLYELAVSQKSMDQIRAEEHNVYLKSKADQELGLEGVKEALSTLNNYYGTPEGKAHVQAEGAASGVIGLLETIESDLTKKLAEINENEESAEALYVKETKENEVEATTKRQAVRYKSEEISQLTNKYLPQATTDRSGVQDELNNVLVYLKMVHGQCDEVAESYADRKARRDREISGLKEGLSILQNQGADMARTNGPVPVTLVETSRRSAHKERGVCLMSTIKFKQQTQDGPSDWAEHSAAEQDTCTAQNFIKVQFCGAGTIHVYSDGVCGSGEQSIVHGATKIISDCQELDFTNGMSFKYDCVDGVF